MMSSREDIFSKKEIKKLLKSFWQKTLLNIFVKTNGYIDLFTIITE